MRKRVGRKPNEALESVLKEAEQNLLAAFAKSQKSKHRGLKGNARAKSVADFLTARLPAAYGVETGADVVDYANRRSGEIDIVIFDKQRPSRISRSALDSGGNATCLYRGEDQTDSRRTREFIHWGEADQRASAIQKAIHPRRST